MSVPKYKQNENELIVLTKAKDLYREAIRISKSEKILPKKVTKLLRDTFLNNARDIYYDISSANEMRSSDPYESKIRKQLQTRAKVGIQRLKCDISFNIDYLDTNCSKYENILNMISDTKRLLQKWTDSENREISK